MSVTQDKAGVIAIARVTLAHNVFPMRPGTGVSSAAMCASYSVLSGSRLRGSKSWNIREMEMVIIVTIFPREG